MEKLFRHKYLIIGIVVSSFCVGIAFISSSESTKDALSIATPCLMTIAMALWGREQQQEDIRARAIDEVCERCATKLHEQFRAAKVDFASVRFELRDLLSWVANAETVDSYERGFFVENGRQCGMVGNGIPYKLDRLRSAADALSGVGRVYYETTKVFSTQKGIDYTAVQCALWREMSDDERFSAVLSGATKMNFSLDSVSSKAPGYAADFMKLIAPVTCSKLFSFSRTVYALLSCNDNIKEILEHEHSLYISEQETRNH